MALAGMVGLLLTGYLIELFGWRTPFFVLGGLLVLFSAVLGTLPGAFEGEARPGNSIICVDFHFSLKSVKNFFHLGKGNASAWSLIIIHAISFFSSTSIMIIHGGWLEREYGLGPALLGRVALIIGIADLIGCAMVTFVADKLGKKKSVAIGIAGTAVGYLLLPLLNRSLFFSGTVSSSDPGKGTPCRERPPRS